jgi:hypothetical protein
MADDPFTLATSWHFRDSGTDTTKVMPMRQRLSVTTAEASLGIDQCG